MKQFLLVALVMLLLSGCGAEQEASTAEETIIVGTSGQLMNFTYEDERGQLTGYDIELLQAIDALLPAYTFQFEKTPFPQLLSKLENGEIDMIANNMAKNEEREQLFLFHKQPYNVQPLHLVVHENRTDIATLEDLQMKTIGTIPTTNAARFLERYIEDNELALKIVYEERTQQLMEYVKIGRIDAMLHFGSVVQANNTYFDAQQKIVGEPLTYSTIYYVLNKQQGELAQQIDEALQTMLTDGTLQALQEKWFGESYSKEFLIERLGK